MKPRRPHPARWLFLVALAAAAALGLVSRVAVDVEERERCARAEAAHGKGVYEALVRMDAWLGPFLEREATRPPFHYWAFFAPDRAYNRLLNELEPGEVLTPSPLLTQRSPIFRLHFQIDAQGRLTSPQVPEGNLGDLAEGQGFAEDREERRRALEELRPLVSYPALLAGIDVEERRWRLLLGEEPVAITDNRCGPLGPVDAEANYQQITPARQVIAWRAKGSNNDAGPLAAPDVSLGRLVPLWIDRPDQPCVLVFVRRVRLGTGTVVQGVVAEWGRLCTALLEQAADLVAGASLRPFRADPVPDRLSDRLLGTVPAVLELVAPAPPALSGWTPVRQSLVIAWAAFVIALGWFALTLKRSFDDAERRRRFASAVTHELRTPLTTFRLYSEMLAKGMVKDPARVAEYLDTLDSESGRLSTLVENVLTYARLEEGRLQDRRERLTAAALLERALPPLAARAAASGFTLECRPLPQDVARLAVSVNPDAIGQILFNLVDNACKYATPDGPIVVDAAREGRALLLRVRDHGPGVPPAAASRIFTAYDRGLREPGDTVPGIGLGLALARGLARDHGGDLTLAPPDGPGACFVLRLETLEG